MRKKILLLIIVVFGFIASAVLFTQFFRNTGKNILNSVNKVANDDKGGLINQLHPLAIESLRKGNYPGSDVVVEQTLDPGINYLRYIVSYKSEGLKIYALLTVPNGPKPSNGWPVVIFNHGFIPPAEYRTTERYIAYTDAFSTNGYIVFRSDYRGHGNSEGRAAGGYGSNDYTIDILNAVASVKKLKDPTFHVISNEVRDPQGISPDGRNDSSVIVDPNNIGMWGHSMGGFITLRSMIVNKDIKAGVIWGGVVASYPDLLSRWQRRSTISPTPFPDSRGWRKRLVEQYGDPQKNPAFWNSISANSFLKDISGPIQLHHGTADEEVPVEFSEKLFDEMKKAGKEVELYTYEGDDHNISGNLYTALQRSVEFFDKYLKQ